MGGSLDALVPDLVDAARALVDAAGRAGLNPRVTSTVRTNSEQRRLYNRFLSGQAGYPGRPPGSPYPARRKSENGPQNFPHFQSNNNKILYLEHPEGTLEGWVARG